jgi:TolA-binding protein
MAAPDADSPSLTFSLQALLHRHESYMAEAEDDRRRFVANIDGLEREKAQAQAENARIVEENRGLLDQLDGLNTALADSDSHVKRLSAALDNTDAELRKLTASATRVADLEQQLDMMESEQSKLQDTLLSVEEDKKSAVQRWKSAECTLRDLHDQVDRIEKEAREERDRHTDMVERLERRRVVERELDGAAGRLKGAAAASELGRNQNGNVVSCFVRDILQDNANLQMGVMELRDMLESSNEEVQSLRDQILSHQPLETEKSEALAPLSEELDSKEPSKEPSRRVSQEFHIHHHYHKPKDKGRRLNRKKRLGNLSLRSASGPSPSHHRHRSTSSASTILSQTSVSIPPAPSRRWSSQTADVSIASSPQSLYRSSIFDRPEWIESSQPTSPESTIFPSPARHMKGSRDQPLRSDDGYDPDDDRIPIQPVIPEEDSPADEAASQVFRPYRSASHDSLFSVAGMDIHTPTRQPARTRSSIVSPSLELSNSPTLSTTTITAGREPPPTERSPQSLLASVAASNRSDTASVLSESGSTDTPTSTPTRKPSIGRRMGGWVKGRWGTAPESSEAAAAAKMSPSRSELSPSLMFRFPGVNQSGPIRGLRPSPRQRTVHVERLDQDLLQESLAE